MPLNRLALRVVPEHRLDGWQDPPLPKVVQTGSSTIAAAATRTSVVTLFSVPLGRPGAPRFRPHVLLPTIFLGFFFRSWSRPACRSFTLGSGGAWVAFLCRAMARSAHLQSEIPSISSVFDYGMGLLICGLWVRFPPGSPALAARDLLEPRGHQALKLPPAASLFGLDSHPAHHCIQSSWRNLIARVECRWWRLGGVLWCVVLLVF
jgi:hypothetical protein